MYENAFSLIDLIQIAAIVFVCWFCYRSGWKHGTINTLEELERAGVVKLQREEDVEE